MKNGIKGLQKGFECDNFFIDGFDTELKGYHFG
jgi:hypothetical protein